MKQLLGKSSFDMGLLGREYRKIVLHCRQVFGHHLSEHHMQMLLMHDLTLYYASKPILGDGGWVMAEMTLIGSTALFVAVRLRDDPELKQGSLAQLSISCGLNNLPLMRRELGLPGISSVHEEDAEGQFAADKRVFPHVNAAAADSALALATHVARRGNRTTPTSVRSLESERVDVERALQVRVRAHCGTGAVPRVLALTPALPPCTGRAFLRMLHPSEQPVAPQLRHCSGRLRRVRSGAALPEAWAGGGREGRQASKVVRRVRATTES